MLAVCLVVLLDGTLAAAAPGDTPITAQPAPAPMLPVPTGSAPPMTCLPGSLLPGCPNPSTTAPPTAPTTSMPPCTGQGCIPQPTTTTPAPANPGTGQPTGDDGNGCEGDAICNFVTNGINAFFRGAVTAALNPLLGLLSTTLLTTPTPDSLPRIAELWNGSWQIVLASYAMLILIAGIVLMSYETLQTRYGVKELAPRIVVGFLSGSLSLWVATQAIEIANALAHAVMGDGLDTDSAGQTLRNLVLGSLNGGIFIIFIGIFIAVMLVVLLVSYIVRVALTVILIAGAPLALMAHALPQTEGIAYWWWKAFGGCLAIQVVQSLTLITAMKVFLAPGGFTLFGPTTSGLVNLLVALALFYILAKIPFWCLGSLRNGSRRSFVGSLVHGFIAYKTLGLLRGRGGLGGPGGGSRGSRPSGDPRPHPNPNRRGPRQTPPPDGPVPRSGPQAGGKGGPHPRQGGSRHGSPQQGQPRPRRPARPIPPPPRPRRRRPSTGDS